MDYFDARLRSVFVQQDLAQAHGVRSDFHVFVLLDVFEGLFEREYLWAGRSRFFSSDPEARMFVSCLALVTFTVMSFWRVCSADHLAFVHLFHRRDEEASAVLQFVDGIGVGRTRFARDDRAVDPHFDFARPRFESFQAMCHDRFAGRCREHIGSQTDDTARGNRKFEPRTVAVGFHVGQVPLRLWPVRSLSPSTPGDNDGHLFDRFALLPSISLTMTLGCPT